VDPLPCGAKLIGLIDCCSGGPLLRLPYKAERDSFQAKALKLVTGPVKKLFSQPRRRNSAPVSSNYHRESVESRRSTTGLTLTSNAPALLPEPLSGAKRNERRGRLIETTQEKANEPRGNVISISSCRAGASTYDTVNGGMLITEFAKILERNQTITLGELHDRIRIGQEAKHREMERLIKSHKGHWCESWKAPIPQFCFSHEWIWNDSFMISQA